MTLWKGSAKIPLVVVIAVRGWRVFPADVDDSMAGCQERWVSGADERRWLIGRQQSKQIDS